MFNNGFDHFKYSVHIRFIRNTANPYSVYKKPNPNTANPYSVYKKTNPNSFISYSVYKKRNYSVPYIFGFGRIIRIRLTPTPPSPETYCIILERPPNEKVNQIQDKIVLKGKILDTGPVLIPYQSVTLSYSTIYISDF